MSEKTLRDEIAIEAMKIIMAENTMTRTNAIKADVRVAARMTIGETAYAIADSMMKARAAQ